MAPISLLVTIPTPRNSRTFARYTITWPYVLIMDTDRHRGLKIGTGFSDENLEQFAEFFKDKVISKPRPYYRYSDQVEPDVWVRFYARIHYDYSIRLIIVSCSLIPLLCGR